MRKMFSEKQVKEMAIAEAKSVKKDITTLVDAEGHDRFIEGDLTFNEDYSGITPKYGKWSLSGTHLIIVACIDVANATVMTFKKLAELTIPQWIYDKIQVISGNDYIERISVYYFATDQSSQSTNAWLRKGSDNKLAIYTAGLTLTSDKTGRLVFDLLID